MVIAMTRLLLALAILLNLSALPAQGGTPCDKIATTVAETKIYDAAPVFYTGSGWKFGREVGAAPANSQIRVCKKVRIGFFTNRKIWYQIKYGDLYGWVFSGSINLSSLAAPSFNFAELFLIRRAFAQSGASSGHEISVVPTGTRFFIYLLAFIAVVLGMFGKVVFDELDGDNKPSIRECLEPRKCLKALIIAPVVFLGFLTAGNFALQNELNIIVGLCLAFQNGFFFQTVTPTKAK